jgi:hypothetical protein
MNINKIDHGYVQFVVLSIFMAYYKSNSTVATSVARNCLAHRSTRVHGVRAVYLSNYMFSCLSCRFNDAEEEPTVYNDQQNKNKNTKHHTKIYRLINTKPTKYRG